MIREEVWRDVPGFEGYYQVSDLGRVKSLNRVREYNGQEVPEKILSFDKGKYLRVKLFKDGQPSRFLVHRLVMLTFKGDSTEYVDHKNEDKWDNRLNNLRYCTPRQNSTFYYGKKDSTSRYIGVHENEGKWVSEITLNRNKYRLGRFNTEEEAYERYKEALKDWEDNGKVPYKKRELKENINIICLEDEEIFPTTKEASEYYNVLPGSISNNIKGLSKSVKTKYGKRTFKI